MKWFRLYDEITEDPKMIQLTDQEFRIWIYLLCYLNKETKRGYSCDYIPIKSLLSGSMKCRIKSIESAFDRLESLGMIKRNHPSIQIVNWDKRQYKSDDVNERVKRYRNVTRNVTVTDQKQIQIQIQNKEKNKSTPPGASSKTQKELIASLNTQCKTINSLTKKQENFNPHQWIQYAVNHKYHPEAISHTLEALISNWDRISTPWTYANKIISVESGNYYERDGNKSEGKYKMDFVDLVNDLKAFRNNKDLSTK